MKILLQLLSDFKFARRRLGGTWYKVAYNEYVTGFAAEIVFWTRKTPSYDATVLETEVWPTYIKKG